MHDRRSTLHATLVAPTLVALAFVATAACSPDAGNASERLREPWVDRPVADWPDFALTNDIAFTDTTYTGIANAFLVDTGADTVGVTVKHMFLAFERWRGTSTIELGDEFVSWRLRSSRDPTRVVTARLLNEDPDEPIGDFAGLKDRDWLLFEVDSVPASFHPLKLRWEPLEAGASGRHCLRRRGPVGSGGGRRVPASAAGGVRHRARRARVE